MSKKKSIKMKDLLKEYSFFLGFGNQPAVKKQKPIVEDNYHANAIDDFIKKNESSPRSLQYPTLPKLKLYGVESETKFLDVTYDALREISKILKKMKTS